MSSSSDDDHSLLRDSPFSSVFKKQSPSSSKLHRRLKSGTCSEVVTTGTHVSIDEAVALRKAESIPVPANITSPSQLKWHKPRTTEAEQLYFPCFIDNAQDDDDNTEEEAMVQYIEFPAAIGKHRFLSKKRLLPFFGNFKTQRRKWCTTIRAKYIAQREAKILKAGSVFTRSDRRAEILFLDRVLRVVQQRSSQHMTRKIPESGLSDEDDGQSCHAESGEDELDDPYSQAVGADSEVDLDARLFCAESPRPKEPIRPGDVIEYYTHLFVAGDPRGLRTAAVLSIDPKRTPILILDNREFLPPDSLVKRIKVCCNGESTNHPGIYRPIESFKLRRLDGRNVGLPSGLNVETERIGRILKKNMNSFRAKATAEGFAPFDMLNNNYKEIQTFASNIQPQKSEAPVLDKQISHPKHRPSSSTSSSNKPVIGVGSNTNQEHCCDTNKERITNRSLYDAETFNFSKLSKRNVSVSSSHSESSDSRNSIRNYKAMDCYKEQGSFKLTGAVVAQKCKSKKSRFDDTKADIFKVPPRSAILSVRCYKISKSWTSSSPSPTSHVRFKKSSFTSPSPMGDNDFNTHERLVEPRNKTTKRGKSKHAQDFRVTPIRSGSTNVREGLKTT